MNNLLMRIHAIDPDVILIDLENPSRDTLEQMFQVSRIVRRPVAMQLPTLIFGRSFASSGQGVEDCLKGVCAL
jgi:hypothetical protein